MLSRRLFSVAAAPLLVVAGAGAAAADPFTDFVGDPTDPGVWQEFLTRYGVEGTSCAQTALPEETSWTADQGYVLAYLYSEQGNPETGARQFTDVRAGETFEISFDRTDTAGMVLCTGTTPDGFYNPTPTWEEDAVLDIKGDPRDPAVWLPPLIEGGVADASCTAIPAPDAPDFIVDRDYILVAAANDEGRWIAQFLLPAGATMPISLDRQDPSTVILCTGTKPDHWDGVWRYDLILEDVDRPGDGGAGHDYGAGGEPGGGHADPEDEGGSDKGQDDNGQDDTSAGAGAKVTVGAGTDDGGASLGPVVQTDRPATGTNAALTSAGLAMLAAAGLAMSVAGLRRRAISRS